VIDIFIDGAIDIELQTTRRKGIGIYYRESAQPISAKAHTARDSTQTELQAICLAITTSLPYQHICLHTDSSKAIRAIQKEANTAKQQVRRAYNTELRAIQKTIREKNLQIEWIKVKAHSNNQSNNLADQLAKAGKTSNNTVKIETDNPTIVDVTGTPIGQDPHHWIKKREQATTILKWQEETQKRHITSDFIWQTD
jgi:ribonuclease HI